MGINKNLKKRRNAILDISVSFAEIIQKFLRIYFVFFFYLNIYRDFQKNQIDLFYFL